MSFAQKLSTSSWRDHLPTALHKKTTNSNSDANVPLFNAVYYPNWKMYTKQPPSSMNLRYVSHIFYAFAWVKQDGSVYFNDEYADIGIEVNGVQGGINDLRSIKAQHPHIKTLLSVGGGGEGSKNFAELAHDPTARLKMSRMAREMVDYHGLDGIDIDWEHPSDPDQGQDYIDLLRELRSALPLPQYVLTSALPAGEWALENINLAQAGMYLDFVNLMTYDFAGPWTSECGHHAQLRTPKHPHNDAARISGTSAVEYVQSQGFPPRKILLGIPCYGRSFLGASKVGDSFTGNGGDEGTFEYRDLPRPGSEAGVDKAVEAAYCTNGDGGFVSYDDPSTVRQKALFAMQQNLGGLFYWTGTGDTNDSRSLVESGWKTLHGL